MGRHAPELDLYISKAAPFAKPILEYVRECVHTAWPEAVETLKWSHPTFTHANGKIIMGIAAFKEHCRVGMWNAEAASALRKAAGHDAKATGSVVKVASLKDLPPKKELLAAIRATAKAAATGKAMMRRQYQTPKAPLEVPADLEAAFKKNKAAKKTFDGFSAPSQRREYVEWIIGAKQEETRQRRVAQAIEMLAEGKTRNWKYEKPAR